MDDAFGLLHELVDLPKNQRAKMFNSENVLKLQFLADDLYESKRLIEVVDLDSFNYLVDSLSEQEVRWSRKLGESLFNSSEHKHAGRLIEAREVLKDFLLICSSSLYKEIAQIELSNIQQLMERRI